MKINLLTLVIASSLLVLVYSTGCVTVKTDEADVSVGPGGVHVVDHQTGDEVHVGPGGVHVEGEDGEVHVGPGGVHVEGEDGEVHVGADGIVVDGEDGEVKVDEKGVVVEEAEGNKVEVRDNVVHITGDDLKDYPENWPEDVKVYPDFRMTDIYVRGASGDTGSHREVVAVTDQDIDMSDVMDFYTLNENWRIDMMAYAPSGIPDDAAWGMMKNRHNDQELEIMIVPEKEGGLTLHLKVYGD